MNKNKHFQAERQAVNGVIQGTASDVMKTAMIMSVPVLVCLSVCMYVYVCVCIDRDRPVRVSCVRTRVRLSV